MRAELYTGRTDLETRARVHAALGEPGRLAIVDALNHGDLSPGELAHHLGMPSNLIAHHINVLRTAGLITRTRSEGDRRRTYLRLAPAALAGLIGPTLPAATRVVFVCTHNSARSQLAAAAWARHSTISATSAGTRPAHRVHPRAVRIAQRHGLRVDPRRTAQVGDVVRGDDLVVAVCDNAHEEWDDAEPRRLHWSVPDPVRVDTDEAFETAYQDLAGRIVRLATSLRGQPDPAASLECQPDPTESLPGRPDPAESLRGQPGSTESLRTQPGPADACGAHSPADPIREEGPA